MFADCIEVGQLIIHKLTNLYNALCLARKLVLFVEILNRTQVVPSAPPQKKTQQKEPKVNTSALGKIMVKKMYWANFKWGRKLKGKKSSFIHVTIIDL